MPVVPTEEVLTAKCLIKQYLLYRARCQLLNLLVVLQKVPCEVSSPSKADWHCSVLKEVVSPGAAFLAGAAVLGSRCALLLAVWLCLLQQPSSATVCSAAWSVLCARLWEWRQCPVELVRGGIMPPAAPGNPRWAARAPGRYSSCQSHPWAECCPCTTVTRLCSLQWRGAFCF